MKGAPEFLPNACTALPFSSAVMMGPWVLLSGEIGIRPDGTLPAGVAAQARQALANIESTLARIGCDRRSIAKCTVMLRDMVLWDDFNVEYLAFFGAGDLPARSAFGVSGLAMGAEVEIECIAVRPSDQHQNRQIGC